MSSVEMILENDHVRLALFVCVVGIALRTWSGMQNQPAKTVNWNQVGLTFIISLVSSIAIVMPIITHVADDAGAEAWLVTIAGAVLTIYGADSLTKGVGRRIAQRESPPATAAADKRDGNSGDDLQQLDDDRGPAV